MDSESRPRRGPRPKLTPGQARALRQAVTRKRSRLTFAEAAVEFGVSVATVNRYVNSHRYVPRTKAS